MSDFAQKTPSPRYGCQECRDDAEMVIGGRAHGSVESLYRKHLGQCEDCLRFDRVLRQVYSGPRVPRAPDLATQSREFASILERSQQQRGQRWLDRVGAPVAVSGLAAAAAALALSLFAPGVLPSAATEDVTRGLGPEADQIVHAAGEGGIEHHAQSFGRIVAGDVELDLTGPDGKPVAGSPSAFEAFPVGTRIDALGPDSVQVALVGKMLVSLEAGSRMRWEAASPELVELDLDHGMLAIRYDRRSADPVLHINTPTAIVRVVGTVFTVEVTPTGQTYVSVLRGHVEVLDRQSHKLIGQVDAGYRFDVASSTYANVGRHEVEIAIPVSNEFDFEAGEFVLADGRVPQSWVVPGLDEDPAGRGVDRVLDPEAETTDAEAASKKLVLASRRRAERKAKADEEDLWAMIEQEVERTREFEVRRDLARCRELYASAETRFRAASCLTRFTRRYGNEPGAAEGYLMIGILRMDFAQDHQSASKYFQKFLAQAPNHELAELAHYRLWLAATERGMISQALDEGKRYLAKYPNGRYVGRILQRYPELKSSL